MDSILNRMPMMKDAEIRQLVNGPESFTPDDRLNLGESDKVSLRTHSSSVCVSKAGRKEVFYLTMHSTHFIYGYMASDIW